MSRAISRSVTRPVTRILTLFGDDPRYRRFLALHPGIWPEVGALEDAILLRHLRRQRRQLGLSFDRWVPPARTATRRQRNIS